MVAIIDGSHRQRESSSIDGLLSSSEAQGRLGFSYKKNRQSLSTFGLGMRPVRIYAQNEKADRLMTNDVDTQDKTASELLILLAEDNEINIETMIDFLDYSGFRTVVARNGAEAIELAIEHLPDVILMDIQMPVMDGLEAIRRLRADQRTVSVPIIALTGLTLSGDNERCMEAGADMYFSKPFSLKALTQSIVDIVVSRRA